MASSPLTTLFVLDEEQKQVHVRGVVRVHVMHGGAVVSNGHSYRTGQHADLVSPRGYSLLDVSLALVNKSVGNPKTGKMANKLMEKGVEDNLAKLVAERVARDFKNGQVFVWVQSLNHSWLTQVERLSGWSASQGVDIVPQKRASARWRRFAVTPEWQRVTDYVVSSKQAPRVMVVGGKGVGKSTFLRFLVNRILASRKSEAVLYIDLDPGQPELALPGCLSAIRVSSPLLSPNCFNALCPSTVSVCTVYVGDVNVSNCAQRYRQALKHLQLIVSSNAELQNLPWLINTMGFNKGLGLTLLRESICLWQPTVFVSIVSLSERKNYDANFKQELDQRITRFFQFPAVPESDNTKVAQEQQRGDQWGIPEPWKVRNLMILTYLCKTIRLFDLKPNVVYVPWETITLQILLDSTHQVENLLHLFNGSFVALSYVDRIERFHVSIPPWPKELRLIDQNQAKHVLGDCHGFGVVRAIQPMEKRFVLVVPDEIRDKHINCLTLGTVQMPEEALLEASKQSKVKPPYRSRYVSQNRLYNPWQRTGKFKGNQTEEGK